MICDSYFEKGDAHFVCQDYALHGSFDDIVYTIVADGCSSVPFSEIGAQILCHVAKYYIEFYYRMGIFDTANNLSNLLGQSIEKRSDEIRKLYNISRDSLEATLIIVFGIKNRVRIFIWGDGIIITKYKNQPYEIREICSPDNTPFYLVSDLNVYRKHMAEKNILAFIDHKIYTKTKSGFLTYKESLPINMSFFKDMCPELEFITICSDGMTSYKDENKNSVSLLDIVPELINFKTTAGEFVKRRMSFFKKQNKKRLWSHYDDVSCATILI